MLSIGFTKRVASLGVLGLVVVGVSLASAGAAQARTVINGPIYLGAATSFGVLGATADSNTGPTVINGDLGVSPGTAISGFPPGIDNGTVHPTDAVAAQAQHDLTTAFNVAASLSPTTSGLGDLNGLSLTPGVYSGGALSLPTGGSLTLAGSATSVWVFQAASTLVTGSGSQILLTGGASACNVFWKVGSSATLGAATQFNGTIMASQAITAVTGATVIGRLLASNAAVTLDTNTVTAPTGCANASGSIVSSSPTITSGSPTAATVGRAYSFTVVATGSPAVTYTVSSGALPAGLSLSATTGVISGTPTTTETSTFTITASNATAPDVSATYTLTTALAVAGTAGTLPGLAATGSNVSLTATTGALLIVLGGVLVASRRRRGTQGAHRAPHAGRAHREH